jgi:PAS domain S-box-containing protein
VKELVRLHGGEITVTSELGRGTAFRVELPFAEASDSAAAPHGAPARAGRDEARAFVEEALRWLPDAPALDLSDADPDPAAARGRVLLADDNADVRHYVRGLLEDAGYEVEAVGNGEEALAAARRTPPDLVLSDVMMPVLDGFGVLAAVRADPLLADIPVIMLSARAGEESRVEGFEHGADDYLVKPFAAKELVARVASNLSLARLRRDNSERMTSLLESLTDGFLSIDANGRCVYANGALRRMWKEQGIEAERVMGSSVLEAFPEPSTGEHARAFQRAMFERADVEIESRSEPWGHWYATRFHPNRDGGVSVLTADITKRKQAEEALLRRTAQFETLLGRVPIGAFLVDDAFRIVEVNPTALPAFGDIHDLIGRDLSQVMHILWPPAYADEIVAEFRRTLETGEPHVVSEHTEERADRAGVRESYEWQIHRTPLPDGGNGVVCYFRDTSAQVLAREERQHLLESERAARMEAERLGRVKDEFLATLSHELRTPLHSIQGWSHLLRHDPTNERLREKGLEVIERNSRAQAQLIADLLDMSRVISGKLRLEFAAVDLPHVVEAAVESLRPTAEAKGVRIGSSVEPLRGTVHGDAERVQQVVWNLLSNAIKFTDAGGWARVELANADDGAAIRVHDNGKGIRAEFLPHIFERFRQEDSSSTARLHGGLGIGLALVKQLVDLHGGAVHAESAGEGMGATFEVTLPYVEAAHGSTSGRRAPPATADVRRLSGVTVLVVDDEPDAREFVKRLLEEAEADVIVAESADEAIGFLGVHHPDVLLSDIGMPGRDGYTFIREVRLTGNTIPAAALTAFARPEDRNRAIASGFQAHVAKPVEPNELLSTVASLARKSAAAG